MLTRARSSLTAILISRFILDLHETNRAMARQVYLTTIELMSADIDIVHHPSSTRAVVSGGGGACEEEELEEWSVSTNPPTSASAWSHHKGSEGTLGSAVRLSLSLPLMLGGDGDFAHVGQADSQSDGMDESHASCLADRWTARHA